MTNKNDNQAFLDSPEYLKLQEQLALYEDLRKNGVPENTAFQRSAQSNRSAQRAAASDYERLCAIGSDDPDFRPGAVTGAGMHELPEFPFPVLPQNSDTTTEILRKRLVQLASENNWHDFDRLNGTPVHGNVNSDEVENNTPWTIRGTAASRADRAQEGDFGVDDACLQREDDWQLFDASIRYVSANLGRLVLIGGPVLVSGLIFLLTKLIELILTGGDAKFEIIEPITAAVPPVRVHDASDLLFYPYDVDSNGQRHDDPQYPRPSWHEDWENDDVIADLQTSAQTPVFDYFKPYTQHQDNFPITNTMFRRIAGFENDNLDSAMNEGRLFITDFHEFNDEVLAQFQHGRDQSDVPNSGGRLYASIALFAVAKNSDKLKIIAIQPTQRPPASDFEWFWWYNLGWGNKANPPSKIITPADSEWTWKMAKNTFTTMYSMSNVVDHLSTHVFLYPIATGFYRNIPEMHPLSALLLPHLTSLAFNNFTGIFFEVGTKLEDENGDVIYGDPHNGLLTGAVRLISGYSSKSFLDGTVRRSKHYHFVDHGQPVNRAEATEFSAIGDFPHHDDNTETWGAIHQWVQDYVGLYYSNNADVIDDYELQAFLTDVAGAGVNGFPHSASSVEELVTTLTHFIYWMSVNHALGNFSAFQPLGALGYYSSLPLDPNHGRSKYDWLGACPRLNVGMALFEFTRLFVDLPTPWHRSLGKYPQGNFMHDPRVYTHLHRFQNRIQEIDDGLREKNDNRRWAYDLRYPSTMTVSPWN